MNPPEPSPSSTTGSWWKLLTRYHWFVLIVAALGWMFDCLDQQLFNLARVPAMRELLAPAAGVPASPEDVAKFGGYATSIFLIGWATGGLGFGVLGDRIGRAKTMLLTILLYSLCTGLSALSTGFWDFAFYRFLTGLGVGGEFAVGVALVAEVMPRAARPYALGLLQALSAFGNISAALISMGMGHLEESGAVGSAWRWMFVIGAFPALLAIVIRLKLKEPERWKAVAERKEQKLGSYFELFGTPRWRKNAIVGLLLAFSGVVGLWGIGFFSIDLIRSIQRKTFEQAARDAGGGEQDRQFIRLVIQLPGTLEQASQSIQPAHLLGRQAGDRDAEALYSAALKLRATGKPVSAESVLTELDRDDTPLTESDGANGQSPEARQRRVAYLTGSEPVPGSSALAGHEERILKRTKEINGRLTRWSGITSLMINLGAFFGIYCFGVVSQRIGRKPTFAIAFVLALLSTALVFGYLHTFDQIFWMVPLMGFCQLALFGGYAIYFPELFPTHLRSTGTSFCYNVGRFVAALGPALLGLLTGVVFKDQPEPMRYAGLTMCSVFLVGLIVLPFAPETRGRPLPEDEEMPAH